MKFNLLTAVTQAKELLKENNNVISVCEVSEDEKGVVTLTVAAGKQEFIMHFKFDGKEIGIASTEAYLPDEALDLGRFIINRYTTVFAEKENFQENINEYVVNHALFVDELDTAIIYGFTETEVTPFPLHREMRDYLNNHGFYLNRVLSQLKNPTPFYLVADGKVMRIRYLSETGELTKFDLVENVPAGIEQAFDFIINRWEVDFPALFRNLTRATDGVFDMTDRGQNHLCCLVHMDGEKTTTATLSYFPNQSLVVDIESQLCTPDNEDKTFSQRYSRSLVDNDTSASKLIALADIFFKRSQLKTVFKDAVNAERYAFIRDQLELLAEKHDLSKDRIVEAYPEWPEHPYKSLVLKMNRDVNLIVETNVSVFLITVTYGRSLVEGVIYQTTVNEKGLANALEFAAQYFDPKALSELEKKLGFLSRFEHRVSLPYFGGDGKFFVEFANYNSDKYLHVISQRGERVIYRTPFRSNKGETFVQVLERHLDAKEVKDFLNGGKKNKQL